MKEKISIVVPCYNVEKYVLRCINSVINQTYGFENIELLLINDASSDNTPSILEGIKNKYPDNVILVSLKQNRGPAYARNVGIKYASSDYIMFLDSDDFIDLKMLEKMYSIITEYDCEMVHCDYQKFSDMNQRVTCSDKEYGGFYWDLTDDQKRKSLFLRAVNCGAWARLYKTSFLRDNDLYFCEKYSYEDQPFILLCYCYLKSYYYYEAPFYFYFQNDEGITHSTYNSDKNKDFVNSTDYLFEELKQRNMYDCIMDKFSYEINAAYLFLAYVNPMNALFTEFEKQCSFYVDAILERDSKILESPYVSNISNDRVLEYLELIKKRIKNNE